MKIAYVIKKIYYGIELSNKLSWTCVVDNNMKIWNSYLLEVSCFMFVSATTVITPVEIVSTLDNSHEKSLLSLWPFLLSSWL